MQDASTNPPLLSVTNLSVGFNRGATADNLVRRVDFDLHAGETLALVGESGAGKSLTALAILQLTPNAVLRGSVKHRGVELIGAPESALRRIRGNDIAMIFQEPMSALNPLHTVEKQIGESLALHAGFDRRQRRARCIELLESVGIDSPQTRLQFYPHQLSGGQRQRVMIAMALANRPDVLLADEPTTALDVTVQARILKLLMEIQRARNLGLILITHDLKLVRKIAARVVVMQHGRVVEHGETARVFAAPHHPYTQKLLRAEPRPRTATAQHGDAILTAQNIRVWFPIRRGVLRRTVGHIKAVNRASLTLRRGRSLGVVGESGSGKTTLALALLKLIQSRGELVFDGKPIAGLGARAMKPLRREIQIVFQDPFGALSPRMAVGQLIGEGLDAHGLITDPAARDRRVVEILTEVEIDPRARFRYPHEFSGGQRQRIAIARALILKPRVLFLDEPTSALDRTVQIQLLTLLDRLQRARGLALVFISHDLSVVRAIADEIIVMRGGDIVEQGGAQELFARPRHPYTRELLRAAFE